MGNGRPIGKVKKIKYMDDIPEGYKLLTGREFLDNRQACTKVMTEWAICLLTDGKCDGPGYGAKFTPLSHKQRNENFGVGEMLIVHDEGGADLSSFARAVKMEYDKEAAKLDSNALVNMYLHYVKGSYKPFILVSSCPGDAHGGVHSRVKKYCAEQKWRFAPVQFEKGREADEWKRLWKLQVEEFACNVVAGGKVNMLEVKITGGGAGCAAERSQNMAQWWIDWIKRLGADVFQDLQGKSQASPSWCPPGSVFIQIGQVIVDESSLTKFASGNKLEPQRNEEGFDFELHSMVLNGKNRFWVFITEPFIFKGGKWVRKSDESLFSSGTY
ncbi:hypothetical protein DUNSADRAFT_8278 [Dunaliella salina]|uniref:Uncharacterized protein n=1 Tax=Dunaliella salina TaxID=3046 RepID=A0ABQ7HA85_DUNSA|nr:hypothetical protein DUNSADRAFT_8278 [Dunaliella salina]|eukprot:KAF5843762.1 hypothetical protein DUNSADRAFT_8278 [Dunaliella salina]